MQTNAHVTSIENGIVYYLDRSENISDIDWTKHAKYNGVSLKHIVRGADTKGLFSSHLVKIEPGCCLELHSHENEYELHEVIAGQGVCFFNKETVDYQQGRMLVIPAGENHSVQAGENGLILLAKFFPALI